MISVVNIWISVIFVLYMGFLRVLLRMEYGQTLVIIRITLENFYENCFYSPKRRTYTKEIHGVTGVIHPCPLNFSRPGSRVDL